MLKNLIQYLHDNQFIRVTSGAPLIDDKNPFELFSQEIYSFENNEITDELIRIYRLLADANSCLLRYFESPEDSKSYVQVFIFLKNIEKIKSIINKMLLDGFLEDIANQ